MLCDNCKSGFNWEGKPTGRELDLAGVPTCVAGSSTTTAILLVADVFGWKFGNSRLLADHFAAEVNATVYIPDFYDGEVVHEDTMTDPERQRNFDIPAWFGRHSREKRWPQVKSFAEVLRARYSKVAAVGYCWGGWAVLRLASEPKLVDAVVAAHPALIETPDFDNVKVPVQLLVPEHDFTFTPELKAYSLQALPETGVPWEYVYFPGHVHGFAVRGDSNDISQRRALERAKSSTVHFINEFMD